MSVIALASAKGSPGVTTLAHRLADVLARRERRDGQPGRLVVVVEADPAGGDLAARRGLAGAPGLASLALSARRALDPAGVLAHCQQLGSVQVLAGVAGYRQGSVVAPVVPGLVAALREMDALVLLDTGRLVPAGPGEPPLLGLADLPLLVTRTGAECVVHARSAVDALRATAVRPELVLVGRPEFPAAAIESAVGAPVLGVVADAPAEAASDPAALVRGRRGDLARSVEALAGLVLQRLCREVAPTNGTASNTGPVDARRSLVQETVIGATRPADRPGRDAAVVPLRSMRHAADVQEAPA